jgi:hypothetical protein
MITGLLSEINLESRMVTELDKNMIDYFLNEMGDIERWSSWDDRKPDIAAEYPELIAALDQLKIAKRTLSAVARAFLDDA